MIRQVPPRSDDCTESSGTSNHTDNSIKEFIIIKTANLIVQYHRVRFNGVSHQERWHVWNKTNRIMSVDWEKNLSAAAKAALKKNLKRVATQFIFSDM